jgi:DNA-binding transcriptional ArsR family regulator
MFRNMSFDTRRLTDAGVMRALAHPTRMDLLELVARDGELTATQAAERLGLTPGNCSYHLRQLAKHGFLEEGPPRPGRSRPWRVGSVRHSWEGVGADAETNAAASALTSAVLERDLARLREWLARQASADRGWRGAAFLTESLLYLTREELAEVGRTITDLVLSYADRIDPGLRPEGSAPVQVLSAGFPLPPTTTGN